jgi:glutamate transport system permease protein
MSSHVSVLFDAPGPRAKRIYRAVAVGGTLLLLLVTWFVLDKLAEQGQLTAAKWKPFLTAEIWTEYLLPGIAGTLVAAAIAIVLALTVGVLLGVGRLSTARWIRTPCGIVVEFFRAVPVLLLMVFSYNAYLYYNVFPSERVALAAVVTGLTLYNGSVVAELVRSGVKSLPSGQQEAALAVGLTPASALRLVLLPQAITAMMPAIVSQLVVVLKDSALGYIITYEDLLNTVDQIGNYKQNLIPAFIVVAAIYIALNWLLTIAAHKVEERTRRRGHTAAGPIAVEQAAAVAVAGAPPVDAGTGGGEGGEGPG